jgi:hypothetical protein
MTERCAPMALGDRGGAGRQRLGSLLDFHQAHAAIGRHRQLVVITESRHVDTLAIGRANDVLALARLHRHAVDLDIDEFFAHAACRAASTMLRPP